MINLMDRFASIADNCQGKILDFGSTEAGLHDYLKKKEGITEIIGVDNIKSENANILHDLNQYPYPVDSESVDYAIAGEIIEHLNNPFGFLMEARRILKKDGKLILTTPNSKMLIYKTWEHPQHKYVWDIHTLSRLIKSAGFKIKEAGFTNDKQRPFYAKLLVRIFPKRSWHLFFICEKDN